MSWVERDCQWRKLRKPCSGSPDISVTLSPPQHPPSTGSSGPGGSAVSCASGCRLNLVPDPVGDPIPQKPIQIKTRLFDVRRRQEATKHTCSSRSTQDSAGVHSCFGLPIAALVRICWGRGLHHLWPPIQSPAFPQPLPGSRSLHFLTYFQQPGGPGRSAGGRDIKCACAE